MNFFTAFQTEVFRPLVTLLIPGALAMSSWLVALSIRFPKLRSTMTAHTSETYVVLFLIVTALGISIEDLGSRIEIHFDMREDKASEGNFSKLWYGYLRTAFLADPIGRRYAELLFFV